MDEMRHAWKNGSTSGYLLLLKVYRVAVYQSRDVAEYWELASGSLTLNPNAVETQSLHRGMAKALFGSSYSA